VQKKIHFSILSILTILWSLSLYFYCSPILLNSNSWIKITFLLTILIVPELFCLIILLSGRAIKEFRAWLVISFLLGLFIIWIFSVKGAPLLSPIGIIIFLLLFLYGVWIGAILFEEFIKREDAQYLQAVSILVAFGVFITFVGLIYILIPLITETNKYLWLGPFASLFLVGFMALVITNLLRTKLVWVASLTTTVGIGLLTLVFLVSTPTLKIFTAIIFFLFCILGYLLIKTTYGEYKRKGESERLVIESKKLTRAKDQLILSLQHHLRTPLVPIRGYLESILEGVYGREENPVIMKKLIEIKKMTDVLSSLIESLLDIYEIKMGEKTLRLENCQIENLIEGIVEELRVQAEEKGIYLKFKKTSLPKMKLDKRKIRDAIWNIVDNAIKYTPKGGVTITPRIKDGKLEIIISDTGIGMNKEEICHFLKGKLFERGEEAKKLYGPGRGIGLSIAVEFIKAHGGKVWAESQGQGRGTTFFIELPIIN